MLKILKKKILFSLDSAPEPEYKSYQWICFRLSEFTPGSVREAVFRLEKAGLLAKINRNRRVLFNLTSLGKDVVRVREQAWDRLWRLAIINHGAKETQALRRVLAAFAYKKLNRGVYLSPFNRNEALKQHFLQHNWQSAVYLVEVKRFIIGDDRQLVKKLWGLEALYQRYLEFINLTDRLLRISKQNLVLLQQAKGGFKTCFDLYFSLKLADPGLPRLLLGSDWPAETAKAKFSRLVSVVTF